MKLKQQHYFVTGTDTGIGKTHVIEHWLKALSKEGKTVLGLKPIASGGEETDQGYCNEDALALQAASSLKLDYDEINPFLFNEAVSPHIAAHHENKHITAKQVAERMQPQLQLKTDHTFVEGAGGVMAPISDDETVLDLMKALDLPVILVVGMRLGCLNHAQLSEQVMQQHGLTVAGWVANVLEPKMECLEENIETLEQLLKSPRIQE